MHNDLDRVRWCTQQEAQEDSDVLRRSTPAKATLALMAFVLVLVLVS